jgi:predicted metal-binding membrane protein
VISAWLMTGMDMGVATQLGSPGFFAAAWVVMMAAMMLPGAAPAVAVAGAVTIAAGAYEFTPLKRHFRRRCRDSAGSGFGFGLCCAGSSAGLMAMLVVLGVMSLGWMAVIAVVVTAQKLLPARAALDVPLALTVIAFGVLIVVTPSLIPGLTPPM